MAMKSRNLVLSGMLAGGLIFVGFALAQGPIVNIDGHRHPNLADAQHHLQQAYEKIDKAQKENKDELGGHAERAKHFLDEADRELKEAAEWSDHHR